MTTGEEYEAGKAERARLARLTLEEYELERGREARLCREVIEANAAGRPEDGYPAREELASLRLHEKIAERSRPWSPD